MSIIKHWSRMLAGTMSHQQQVSSIHASTTSNQLHNRAVEHLRQQGINAVKLGRTDQATQFMRQAIDVEENGRGKAEVLCDLWKYVSIYEYRQESYQLSLDAAEKVIYYNPQGAWGFFRRALARLALDDRETARDDLKKSLELWPEFQAAQNELRRLGN